MSGDLPSDRTTGDEGRILPDRADYDPHHDPDEPVPCEVCGGTMVYTGSCKLHCPVCGYTRDCGDP